jgi:YHS domain-containing protein
MSVMTRVDLVTSLAARLVVILTAVLLTGAGLPSAPDPPQDRNTVKDPVCGMSVKPADARFKSEYQGKTYYFCSEGCKQKFDKEPARYAAPKQSGQAEQSARDPVCGMTVNPAGAKFKSEYQGKTYHFCSEGCKQKFDKEPARYAGT